jgi:CheY-like chemotaxis protein
VMCNPNEMESALLNLCINARDAMAEGGRLTIATEDLHLAAVDILDEVAKPGLYVVLSVADTGMGMPPEVLDRVFEPFFTTKPQGQGTGLGLSQVWSFARQSGGLVRVESAPGQGTAVRLLLPLHARAAATGEPGAVPSKPEEAGEAGLVLLVDDEDAARQPVADQLRELGHTVLEARDGSEALQILATTCPDLLITDVGLPNGMNGRQVAEAARKGIPGLPVLFITGYAGTQLPPGIDVIDKPFELDVLVRRVRAILQASRQTATSRDRGSPA